MFRAWLSAQCDQRLEYDYRLFISDWGYLLDEVTSLDTSHVDEIKRCFYGTSGPTHFMHTGPSRYVSWQVHDVEAPWDDTPTRLFDAVNKRGSEMLVLAMLNV